jgi:hypothetical protein
LVENGGNHYKPHNPQKIKENRPAATFFFIPKTIDSVARLYGEHSGANCYFCWTFI